MSVKVSHHGANFLFARDPGAGGETFGENDPERRRAAIDDIYTEDGMFYEPSTGIYRGRDEIDHIAGDEGHSP